MPPIIGLTTYGYREGHTNLPYYDHNYALPIEYVDSVRRAGGIPLLIPPGDNNWQALWSILDGIIVTGGTDVAPEHYGGDVDNPNVHADDADRDTAEIELIQYAVTDQHKPVLCVCRGLQVLNVAMGGTLHAHIPEIRENNIHRSADGWTQHDCMVEPGSQLAQIMGSETVHTYSGHHQAVDKIGEGLQIIACAPDDLVEALTLPEHPWLIGVQWHPEKSSATDPTQQRLFDALVSAAERT